MPDIIERKLNRPSISNNQLETKPRYYMSDLNSVFTHWDYDKKCNIPTENIKGDVSDDRKSSK